MEDQYAQFMSEIMYSMDPFSPKMLLVGPTVTQQPYARLSCEIETAGGDEGTVVRNVRLLLFLDYDSDVEDGVEIDLTLEAYLQSVNMLFKDDMIPVQLLVYQPNLTCIQAIIAHTVAKKASYVINVVEQTEEDVAETDTVLFTLNLGKGNLFQAKVDRDKVAKYFGWEPLTPEMRFEQRLL